MTETTDTLKTYGLADFVKNSSGQTVKSAKAWGLYHSGDYVDLEPGKVAGVNSITVKVVKVQEEEHFEAGIRTKKTTQTYDDTYTVKAGETKKIECKEQYTQTRENSGAVMIIPEEDRIGDVNMTVTLYAIDPATFIVGGATDPDKATFDWFVYDIKDDKVLKAGKGETSIDDCKTAIKAYTESEKITYYSWKIFDEAGNLKDSGSHHPTETPFPWWIVGVGVTIAVIAVIVIYLWKRGRPAAMPSPGVAAAPAPTAPAVVVVK